MRAERVRPIKWSYEIICDCGKRMNACKNMTYRCKCGKSVTYETAKLLIKANESQS